MNSHNFLRIESSSAMLNSLSEVPQRIPIHFVTMREIVTVPYAAFTDGFVAPVGILNTHWSPKFHKVKKMGLKPNDLTVFIKVSLANLSALKH